MDMQKSHDLPSIYTWKNQKAGQVIQSESEDLRMTVADYKSSLSPKVQESRELMSVGWRRWMFQLKQ